jgi:hypothetical protein
MSLRWVHAVLILLSAVLAVVFGLWCLSVYRQEAGAATLAAAMVSFALSLGLVVYDSWFLRKTRRLR